MSLMIESIESRVLLSASAGVIEGDLAAGTIALANAKANLKTAISTAALEIKGFKTDVKGVKLTPTQKSALTTLEKTEASDASQTNRAIGKILSTGTTRGAQLEGALKSLSKHPSKTSLQLKVAAALVRLQGVFSGTVISTVESNVSTAVTTLDTDLAAVGTAIPSTEGTASAMESTLTTAETTLSNDAAAITNVITALATDLA